MIKAQAVHPNFTFHHMMGSTGVSTKVLGRPAATHPASPVQKFGKDGLQPILRRGEIRKTALCGGFGEEFGQIEPALFATGATVLAGKVFGQMELLGLSGCGD